MAPKVQVPMDFGVKYLGSPSHSNLKFRLQDGKEIPANSVIISYNSPVIDSLTTDLLQTSIDVDDFGKEVVQDFVTSCYSGELQNISKDTLREMNKMSCVFEVSWIADRCVKFFKTLVDELDSENYEDQLYVFEEAMYMLLTIKKKNFMELVVDKFSTEIAICDQFFVPQYLTDISSRSQKQLSFIIEIVQKHKHILMGVLIENIERNPSNIDANSRFLLKNVSFAVCNKTHKPLYQKLVDSLAAIESPSKEDYMLMVNLFRRSEQTLSALQIQDFCEVPNLSLGFKPINDHDDFAELLNFLLDSPLVTNSYIFFDAVYFWLFQFRKEANTTNESYSIDYFTEIFAEGIAKRGWSPLPVDYIASLRTRSYLGGLQNDLMDNHPHLTTMTGYRSVRSISDYTPCEFFSRDHDIKFLFETHTSTYSCDRIGSCGFILRVSSMSGRLENDSTENSFNIKLLVNPELYPYDLHFHSEFVSAVNMHFAINVDDNGDYPVTWCDKPSRDGTGDYFCWGVHHFYKKGAGSSPVDDPHEWFAYKGDEVSIRPVVYYMIDQR